MVRAVVIVMVGKIAYRKSMDSLAITGSVCYNNTDESFGSKHMEDLDYEAG